MTEQEFQPFNDPRVVNPYYFSLAVIEAAKQLEIEPDSPPQVSIKELRSATKYLAMCGILSRAAMESDPAAILSVNRVKLSDDLIEASVFDGLLSPEDVPYLTSDKFLSSHLTDALSASCMVSKSSNNQDRDEDSRQERALIFFNAMKARRANVSLHDLKPPLEPDVAKELEMDPASLLF